MKANETQIGGTHYTDMSIQPWDAMQAWMTPQQFCGYLLGTAIAYLARVNVDAIGKGGLQDIEKARHVLAKLSETWNCRVFKQFPKEVMQTEGHSDPQPPATTPAVSESAAGEWPGPDWSQAPEWADWWAMDLSKDCEWHANKPDIEHEFDWEAGWYSDGRGAVAHCFNYTGHWRDSLRKRPDTAK